MLIERRDRYQGSSSVAVHLGFWDRTSGWYGECSWGRPAGQRVPGTHLSQLFQPWDLSMCLCSGELNSILHTCSANTLQTKLTLTPCQKRIIFKSTTDSMLCGERISTERPVTWWWAACAECPYISDSLESRTVSPWCLPFSPGPRLVLSLCEQSLSLLWNVAMLYTHYLSHSPVQWFPAWVRDKLGASLFPPDLADFWVSGIPWLWNWFPGQWPAAR